MREKEKPNNATDENNKYKDDTNYRLPFRR